MPPAQIKVIDPSVRASHAATLPTREERRENLNNIPTQCANFAECGNTKPRSELKVCAKCKVVKYCSQACQKSHWRAVHKAQCTPAGEGSPQILPLKLAERALAVPVIVEALLNISVLTLDLLTDPTNAERFVVKVTCTASAADLQAYMRRVFAGLPKDPGAQVCLSFSSVSRVPFEEVDERTRQAAADMRVKLAAQIGGDRPMVTFWFVKDEKKEEEDEEEDEEEEEEQKEGEDKEGQEKSSEAKPTPPAKPALPEASFSSSLQLPEGAIAYMVSKPKDTVRSAIFGDQEVEKTEQSMRELINNTIRMDSQNKLHLRAYPTVVPH